MAKHVPWPILTVLFAALAVVDTTAAVPIMGRTFWSGLVWIGTALLVVVAGGTGIDKPLPYADALRVIALTVALLSAMAVFYGAIVGRVITGAPAAGLAALLFFAFGCSLGACTAEEYGGPTSGLFLIAGSVLLAIATFLNARSSAGSHASLAILIFEVALPALVPFGVWLAMHANPDVAYTGLILLLVPALGLVAVLAIGIPADAPARVFWLRALRAAFGLAAAGAGRLSLRRTPAATLSAL